MTSKKIRPFAFWRTLPEEKNCLAPNEVFLNSNWSVFFCVGHGIKCYKCVSEKGWDDCVPGNDTTCLNSTGSCLQFEFDGEIPNAGSYRVFQKECTMKSVCNDDICKRYRHGSIVRKCNFQMLRKWPVQ